MSIYDYHILKSLELSDERVLSLLPAMETRVYEAGDIVYDKGEPSPPWCHVVTGMVNASYSGAGNKNVSVNIYSAGSWLGETSFITQSASTHQYRCLTQTRLLCLPYSIALKTFKEDIHFSRYLARLVAWRSQQHTEMLALMKTGSPSLRVVMGLAMFAESISNGTSHLPSTDTQEVLKIPVKQEVLASMCGVSRGIFSECIQKLAQAGWIELSYATLSLLRANAWKQFLQWYRQNAQEIALTSTHELIAIMNTFHVAANSQENVS